VREKNISRRAQEKAAAATAMATERRDMEEGRKV
jgi:hypothetical protein